MEHGTLNVDRFHTRLRAKMDEFVHLVYKITKSFPREELYGVTSQLRRSSLSVILNYIEGRARMRDKVYKVFLETSYASLQEAKYLLEFSFTEKYINQLDFDKALGLADEIGAMLWSVIKSFK